jgi:uncharacterized protein (DUF1697 family)
VNVGRNRKVEMPRLKSVFERLGFDAVRTYINSGNVIFRSRARDKGRLTRKIEAGIEEEFKSPVAVLLRDLGEMEKLVRRMPDDWTNDQRQRCDVMFLWSAFDRRKVLQDLPIDEEIDDVRYVPGAVIWRIDAKNAPRSRRTKLTATPLYRGLTVRNVNTVRKLAELMR